MMICKQIQAGETTRALIPPFSTPTCRRRLVRPFGGVPAAIQGRIMSGLRIKVAGTLVWPSLFQPLGRTDALPRKFPSSDPLVSNFVTGGNYRSTEANALTNSGRKISRNRHRLRFRDPRAGGP